MATTININISGYGVKTTTESSDTRHLLAYSERQWQADNFYTLLPGFSPVGYLHGERKLKKKKKKNCTNGQVCGFSCISKTKTCIANMTTAQLKEHNKAKRLAAAEKRKAAKGGASGVQPKDNQKEIFEMGLEEFKQDILRLKPQKTPAQAEKETFDAIKKAHDQARYGGVDNALVQDFGNSKIYVTSSTGMGEGGYVLKQWVDQGKAEGKEISDSDYAKLVESAQKGMVQVELKANNEGKAFAEPRRVVLKSEPIIANDRRESTAAKLWKEQIEEAIKDGKQIPPDVMNEYKKLNT